MRSRNLASHFAPPLLLGALLLFGCLLKEPDTQIQTLPVSRVNGYLMDKADKPVAGALLRTQQGHSATSGIDGWFQMEMEAGKDTIIHVFHGDYQETLLVAKELKTGTTVPLGSIRLRSRFAIIRGMVMDSAGGKLRGAAVSVEHQDVFALSGGNSEFTLYRVLPGKLMLYFSHGEAGWGDTGIEIIADSLYSGLVLREELQGGGASGTVVDSIGKPVEDAIVRAQNVLETRTDSLGMFSFSHLPSRYDTRIEVVTPFGNLKRGGIRPRENSLLSLGKLQPKAPAARAMSLSPVDAVPGEGKDMTLFVGVANDSTARIKEYFWDWRAGSTFDTSTRDGTLRVEVDLVDTLVRVYAEVADSSGSALFTDTATLRIIRVANRPPVFIGGFSSVPGALRIVNLGDSLVETVRAFDPDGDKVTLKLQAGDSSLSLRDTVLRFISKAAGTAHVRGLLIASDGSDTAWLPFSDSVNFPPVLTNTGPTLTVGIPFELALSANDKENDSVYFTLLPGEPGAIARGSVFKWTPAEPDTSIKEIHFNLRDEHGAQQEGILPVVVLPH
jgi:hypothetical protein